MSCVTTTHVVVRHLIGNGRTLLRMPVLRHDSLAVIWGVTWASKSYSIWHRKVWRQACLRKLDIVMRFFLNNQLEVLIIPILFCYKTLHVLGNHHQEFCTVHSELVSFMRFSDDRFQAGFWRPFPSRVRMELCSILTLLGNGHQNLHETYEWWMYSRKLLMMGTVDARNM